MGAQAKLADDLAALAERMHMAVDVPDAFQACALRRAKLEADRQEVLAHDVKPRAGQEMVDIGDASGNRILDRNHGERSRAIGDRREGVLEGRRRQGLPSRMHLFASDVGVCAGLSLIGDDLLRSHGLSPERACRSSTARARSRSLGVSTPSGTSSTSVMSMRIPASSARSCSSLSLTSSGEGGSAT